MKNYIRKINYHETDKMGVVHHSNYIKYMEEARESVAACAAYMLFDDFETIGNEVAGAPSVIGNQIHLFYLNGFYVTLSILLDRLADAFSEINQQIPTSLVNVRIRNGKIQFPNPNE